MGGVEKGVDKRWAGLERDLTLVVKNRVRDQSLGEVKSGGSGWVREPSCVYLKSRVLSEIRSKPRVLYSGGSFVSPSVSASNSTSASTSLPELPVSSCSSC